MSRALVLIAAISLASPSARGEPQIDLVASYCEWVSGAALSERALLHAPEAVVGISRDLLTSSARVRAGLAYDAIGYYRGKLVERRAKSECARFRANYAFVSEVELGSGETKRAALVARLAVLEEALPHARELVASAASAFAGEHATIEELQAIRLRADTLAMEFATTWTELEALGKAAPPLRAARLTELLSEQVAHEGEVEELEGRLRRAGAFRVALDVGYESSATLSRSVPTYGVLEISYNLGNRRQLRADERARTGRTRWAEARESGALSRSARVMLQLRAELASERKRFAEIAVLRADVEARLGSLDGIESDRVRRVRDHLWFDWVTARAQEAYLSARVRELEVALADDGAGSVIEAAFRPTAGSEH